jgi:TrmH family RNA methyltransferase
MVAQTSYEKDDSMLSPMSLRVDNGWSQPYYAGVGKQPHYRPRPILAPEGYMHEREEVTTAHTRLHQTCACPRAITLLRTPAHRPFLRSPPGARARDSPSGIVPIYRSFVADQLCRQCGDTRDCDVSSDEPRWAGSTVGWACNGLLHMTPFRHQRHPIDSRNHPAIKRIRLLHDRAARDRNGLLYIEGLRFVVRASLHRVPIEALVVCQPLLIHPLGRRLLRQQRRAGIPILEVTPEVLASIALVDDPQGIGAVVQQRWTSLEQVVVADDPCWVMLDTVRSPGNLGTILRTSEAVGGSGLMLLGDAVDPYDPATVRASMGSLFSQRFVRTTMADLLRWKDRQPCLLVSTAPTAAIDYQAVDYSEPVVLLLGGERKGLSPELQAQCDVMVRIPMSGQTDSLNLSVAASLLLYEVFNQRRREVLPMPAPDVMPLHRHRGGGGGRSAP